ncbi:hypothetical protein PENSPDRAFT_285557 [Peniophora sp. CONT]|nr:hypothetical protein PENSPDRAFT_285557 [Peniophora sp. CONT]
MRVAQPCDFTSVPPHPLIYASLVPSRSPHRLRRIDLHKPQTKYTVGRGPLNDFVLDEDRSGQIDWTHCTLLADEEGNVRIVDNFTTNGIWVDFRRLAPGESCILQDGDSIRFGLCALSWCHPRQYMTNAHVQGLNHAYVFHSFATRDPPGLSVADLELRSQLRELERSKTSIIQERLRLDRELQSNEEQIRHITQSMRDIPPTKEADTLWAAQSLYDLRSQPLRSTYPHFFPLDVRDFRPQPWLLPDIEPEDDSSSLYAMCRSFGALPNQRPPPLEKNYRISEFTRALHHEDAPDWSHPEVIWGELQSLNLSTPLNVPPSIIFWSIVHHLPVYMHPDYRVMSRQGPFAHPYACSEYVFSDESAAEYRAELGLPPLENPRPLRPIKALRVMEGRTITDEGYIAERVALLHSTGGLPPKPISGSSAPKISARGEEPPNTPPRSLKHSRSSNEDLTTGVSAIEVGVDVASSFTPDVAPGHPTAGCAPKRRRISQLPSPRPSTPSGAPAVASDNA